MTLDMPDPSTPGDEYDMQLLEPLSWINSNDAATGNWIELNLPELQISGLAQVQSISACPTIQSGPGQVVLGTFEHVSNDVVDVNLVGQDAPLQVTAGHLLWSLDADGWVQAGDLYAGERLAGEDGPVTVESVTPVGEPMAVYNLDVEYDHRYLVTSDGVLVHNASSCVPEFSEIPDEAGYVNNNPKATPNEKNVGKLLNNMASDGQLGDISKVEGNVGSGKGDITHC